jgi:hypothetical protein
VARHGGRHAPCWGSLQSPTSPSVASLPLLIPTARAKRPAETPGSTVGVPAAPAGLSLIAGALGLTFAFVGLGDLALAWFPVAFGSPEWEFGTATTTLNGLPVPAMGLALLLGAALAADRPRHARTVATLLLILAVAILAIGVLWATTLPMAFRPVTNEVVRLGLQKAVAKTAIQLLAYPPLFVVLGVAGWRRSAR